MEKRIVLVDSSYDNFFVDEEQVKRLFYFLDTLSHYKFPSGELSIAFMDDRTIGQIHNDFMNDPSATDVITFPGDAAHDFSGEICVSVDHALTVAKEMNLKFEEELTLYLIHGWLHLAGYDDLDDTKRAQMREAEKNVMDLLRKNGLIPDFRVRGASDKDIDSKKSSTHINRVDIDDINNLFMS